MLHVSHEEICNALGIVRCTSVARTRGLVPYCSGPNGAHRYLLSDVLPKVKDRERDAVPALFELAQDDGNELWVGNNSAHRGWRLESWLRGEQIERLLGARTAFTTALARSVHSSTIFLHLEPLRLSLVLPDPILRWTVLGDADALPVFESWAVPFSITNARRDEIETEMRGAA